MISLLGRLVFSEEKLKKIITKNSNKPNQLIKAYNLCDGTLTVNQIGNKIEGITSRALNDAVIKWEENGILFDLGEKIRGKPVIPLHLYKIDG